jgi:hypothetical protein
MIDMQNAREKILQINRNLSCLVFSVILHQPLITPLRMRNIKIGRKGVRTHVNKPCLYVEIIQDSRRIR